MAAAMNRPANDTLFEELPAVDDSTPPAAEQVTPATSGSASGIFPGVIGQTQIKEFFVRAVAHKRLSHAYLFAGPSGTGRLAMALELARTLNCIGSGEANRYGKCRCTSCRAAAKLQHPNLMLTFPLPRYEKKEDEERINEARAKAIASIVADPYLPLPLLYTKSGQVHIDLIREIRNSLALVQDRPGMRVVILIASDDMDEKAANALLKHLEEPPDRCCLILIAESTREMLPTIVSRCQVIWFPRLGENDIAEGLTARRGINPELAISIARLADGSYRRAVALSDGRAETRLAIALEFLRASAQEDALKITEQVEKIIADETRPGIQEQLDYVSFWIREALGYQAGRAPALQDDAGDKSGQNSEVVEKMASRYHSDQFSAAMTEIEETRMSIGANVNPAMALIALAIRLNRILS